MLMPSGMAIAHARLVTMFMYSSYPVRESSLGQQGWNTERLDARQEGMKRFLGDMGVLKEDRALDRGRYRARAQVAVHPRWNLG